MVRVIRVLADEAGATPFRSMTFPAMRSLLEFRWQVARPWVLGAFEDEAPVGLALAVPGPEPATAQLLSIFVQPERRGSGVGSALLRRLAEELGGAGVREVTAKYMTGQPSTPALERMLLKSGWSPPVPRMVVVRCTLDSIRPAPWLHKYALPAGHEILPWVEVTAAERERIRATNAQSPWIPAGLDPFESEPGLEPITSVALRVDGEIVGWCLNHVVHDVLRFTCSFVRRDLQRRGRAVLLWSESIARAPRAGMSTATWGTPVRHAAMVAFIRRHLQPYSVFFAETRGVSLALRSAASEGPRA